MEHLPVPLPQRALTAPPAPRAPRRWPVTLARVRRRPRFDIRALPGCSGLPDWLVRVEAPFHDIIPGCQKRIRWAGEVGHPTETALVYLHGFSASGEELQPTLDRVAAGLGANLFLTRLHGHGRGPAAMAEPRAADWMEDLSEAVAVGERLGRKVWLIGCSTGASLAALAAADPRLAERLAGVVLVSPNFGLGRPHWQRVNWPLARHWLRLAMGGEIGFIPASPAHGRYWTCHYPPSALVPMGWTARRAARTDYGPVTLPTLILYSPEDHIVSVPEIRRIAARWGRSGGRPPEVVERHLGPGDDPDRHILAGHVLSPGQIDDTAQLLTGWIATHG
ncbi:alpha/beta fold hydrolase [Frigidibacter sp. MR17.14]|uniref:alpha/beta hydrolase n=1 Tax=Frigidibacter sp. MR17.14 TaxID=3126509 RepID=UPI003012F24D